MSHACHRFWECYKTLTFGSLLKRRTIPCACHAKRHLNLQKWSEPLVLLTFWLQNVLRATTACTFLRSEFRKVVRSWCVLHILTSKWLFRHLNFHKWSEAGVFMCVFTFWLQNVLRARTVCTFSTSQLPKVVRTWCVLYIFTSKCASRWPAGSAPAALASLLFDPPEPQIIGKTQCFAVSRLSYLFAHLRLLSSDSFSSLIFSLLLSLFSLPLPCSAFHLSILSEVWLLNFLRSLKYMFPPVKAAHGYRWFHMKRSKLAALIVCGGWLMYCMCMSAHKHM